MVLFKKKRGKIKFNKVRFVTDKTGEWYEIKDSSIIDVLVNLQTKFDFKIISIKLKDSFHRSKIVIQCNRSDKCEIFMEFVSKLSGYIDHVKI